MRGKLITVGVTGGIAAYKAAELVRLLVKEEAQVRVAMTRHATRFVGPLTFEALSGHPVIHDIFARAEDPMAHISWGQEPDLVIVAPATANLIGKMAHGMADDFLSTLLVAATAPVLLCPSMNSRMYENPAVQENLQRLKGRGVRVMDPSWGDLACGAEGAGRLPEPWQIVEEAKAILAPKDLEGLGVLVTAGPTVEPMDPVRVITNRSSGRMGYALAQAARRRGARVVLVTGPTSLTPPQGVETIRVTTALQMRDAVLERCTGCDIVIKAAAVSDYRPRERAAHKVKKGEAVQNLELQANPDILAELGAAKSGSGLFLVGFAAETEDLIQNAKSKLRSKRLDMIVANDVSRPDTGFQTETNAVKILYPDGSVEELGLMSKEILADEILDRVVRERRATD